MPAMLAVLLDLLLPSVCPRCREAPGPGLCPACEAALPWLGRCCPLCAAPRLPDASCDGCRGAGLRHLDGAMAALAYRGAASALVGDAKAGAQASAVGVLSTLLPLPVMPFDAVVPVPPSPGRRPGPHLATACARRAARLLGIPLVSALACTRAAREQHRLSRSERARNVVDLFTCRRPMPRRLLLVDDILTSGATISAAAGTLRQAGARTVVGTFLCRTPRSVHSPV
jgi:predicted amidophosphoribosyltransferase